ncbi:MAG: phage tail tube protein [Candidatus Hodarchaeales archaeon]
MSVFTGRRVSVGIGKETSRGTGVAASHWLPKTAITFDDKVNKDFVVGSYGSIAAPLSAYVVGRWAEGNIEGEININSFGLLLLALFGTVSTSADTPESGVYTHNYTFQDDNACDSLTIHVSDPVGDMRFELAMINSMTININPGEIVKFSANFISKYHKDTSSTPSWSKDYHFIAPDLTFKVANNVSGLSAASKISVKSLSITFEKLVERIETLGSFDPEDIVNKGMKINGTIELNYEDRTWRDYMLNGNVRAMQIELESKNLTIGTTTKPKFDMVFPKVHFHTWEPTRELDEVATQTINFEVLLDISTSPVRLWSTMQLINTQSSY